jgi:hypothetical protein
VAHLEEVVVPLDGVWVGWLVFNERSRRRTLITGIFVSRGITTWTVRVQYTSARRAASSVPSPRGRRCAVEDLGRVKI